MDHLAPVGPVYQAGTLSGNPIAMAAGKKSLELATEQIYDTIRVHADRLADLIHDALGAVASPTTFNAPPPCFPCDSPTGEGHNFSDMKQADTFRYAPFFHALLDNGVYTPPSVLNWFVSAALTDDDFDRIEAALKPAAQAAAAAQNIS